MTSNKVKSVLIVGDTHFDDYNPIRFHNYWANSVDVMNKLIKLKKETGVERLVFAGDFIGLRQSSRFRDLRSFTTLIKFLTILGPETVIVRGNHDYADGSAYDALHSLGLFKTPADVGGKLTVAADNGELDIHLVDYGKEEQNLPFRDEAVSVIVAHAEFTDGSTHFEGAFDINDHYNWLKASHLFTGHIHIPTAELKPIKTVDGSFTHVNLGCLTRTTRADKYDEVNYVVIGNKKGNLSLDIKRLELSPYDELFTESTKSIDTLVDEVLGADAAQGRRDLANLLDLVSQSNITYGGVEKFIDEIPGVNKETRKQAHRYIARAKKE